MRTLMMMASVAMVASGVFCLANGSAAFISLAFVIGLVFCLMGVIEIIIGRRADFETFSGGISVLSDGVMMLVLGVVILAGQITDDYTALMVMAVWLLIESVLLIGRKILEIRENSAEQNLTNAVLLLMFILSVLMFFNNKLFSVSSTMCIGVAMILLGVVRIMKSFEINYDRAGFLTGNQERLEEALLEEKAALAKAKEGIREQKAAQRRIEKIRLALAQEKSMLEDAKQRKHMAKNEKEK